MVPPYADATGAAALAVIGVASIAFKPADGSNTTFAIAEVALFSVAAVFAYSAYTGHKSAKRCRALNALPAAPPAKNDIDLSATASLGTR